MKKAEFDKKYTAEPFGSEYVPIHERPSWDLGATILPQRCDTCSNSYVNNNGHPFCLAFKREKVDVPNKYRLLFEEVNPVLCPHYKIVISK